MCVAAEHSSRGAVWYHGLRREHGVGGREAGSREGSRREREAVSQDARSGSHRYAKSCVHSHDHRCRWHHAPRTSQFCLLPLPSPADRSKRGNEIRSESERVRSSNSHRRSKEGSQIRSGSEQIRSGSSRRSKDGSQIRSGSERIRSGSSRRSKEGRETRSQSERIRSSDNSSNRSRKSPVSSSARDKFIQRTGATVVAKGKRDAGSSQNHTSIDSGGSGSSRRASQQRASSLHSSSWHASTSFDRRKARTLEEMLLPTP